MPSRLWDSFCKHVSVSTYQVKYVHHRDALIEEERDTEPHLMRKRAVVRQRPVTVSLWPSSALCTVQRPVTVSL